MAFRTMVVEDDPRIAALVATYLQRAGYEVRVTARGGEALAAVDAGAVDLLVLDVGLPDADGFDVCERVAGRVPVILLTARDEEEDRVGGLRRGADDYVTKPFSPRELVARVEAVLRRGARAQPAGDELGAAGARAQPAGRELGAAGTRAQPAGRELGAAGALAQPPNDVLRAAGGVTLDVAGREVRVNGVLVELAAREFDLLAYLAARAGTVVTREALLRDVWGFASPGRTRTVEQHVLQVRRKLGRDDVIATVRGVGFKAQRAERSQPASAARGRAAEPVAPR